MQSMLYPFEQWLDLRQAAWVEDDMLAEEVPHGRLTFDGDFTGERCQITRHEPHTIELEAELNTTGLVVLAEVYYPGWTLEVETEGVARLAPLLRTNRIMRGALLPAGKHKLVYRYEPWSFYSGAAISLIAIASAISLAVANRRNRGRP
jgi:uncharacterized membrane protein YfhO